MIGSTLSHYQVFELLGAGGMGEVYRASDTKLGRDVALKVLRRDLAADPERLSQLGREARLLASLNHPNIATLFGFESAGDVHFLVMELVPGETLAQRIGRARLSLEDALPAFGQIADALEAAHERGILHRDLKPANVKITPQGRIKVLDFGLARVFRGEGSAPPSESPTLTREPAGRVAGTAAYMSPEQARGLDVDQRSDIWSFGCVLYEALVGRPAFAGPSVSDILAAVLTREPDWSAMPEASRARLEPLLRRCLNRDRSRRLHHAADVRLEMEEAGQAPAASTKGPAGRRGLALIASLVLAAAAALGAWHLKPAAPAKLIPMARLALSLGSSAPLAGLDFPALALSPAGSHLAYVASVDGRERLVLRALGEPLGMPIPGTEGARSPFFSPDGQWVGFFAGGKLKKVAVRGGEPVSLCNAPNAHGATWVGRRIVFAPIVYAGLSEVSEDGGTPRAVTVLDSEKGERAHRWPELLPGGRAVVFTIWTGARWEDSQVVAQSLQTGERRVLVQGGTSARYAQSGHLIYARAGTLMAVPFDHQRLEVTGPAVPVAEGVLQANTGAVQFALSGLTWLLYMPGGVQGNESSLVRVDRLGRAVPLSAARRAYFSPRVSPDGGRVVVEIAGASTDLYVLDLQDDRLTRLTFEASNTFPVWTPDGKRVGFQSNRAGPLNLFWKPADGSGSEERLTTGEHADNPSSWSPDGRLLAYHKVHPKTGRDLWVVPTDGDREPGIVLASQANEGTPAFSPTGSWLAYTSDESGRSEIYVRPFPGPGGKWQVSTEGGTEPVWARSGRELFFWSGDRMMAAPIAGDREFSAGKPVPLFEGRYERPFARPNYDVTPDGRYFVMIKGTGLEPRASQLNVLLGWAEGLRPQTRTQ
jgi:serine/threonine-protein kinase